MKNFNKILFSLVLACCSVFLLGVLSVQAAGLITVDFEDDPLFEIENFYPGKSVTKDVSVKNEDVVERDLYVTMSGMDNEDFADQINFYVIKESSGKYFVGGEGDRMTLDEMDDAGNAFVERMTPGDSTDYEIKVKLKISTGNEFQNEEIESFKIGLAFSDLPNPASPPYRSGQLPGGNEEGNEDGEVEGVESENNEETAQNEIGEVFGEQTDCHGWPLWVWIMSLAIYIFVFLWVLFSNIKEQRKEGKVRWFWPMVFILGVFLYWYNFDKCEEYKWFIISAVISSFVFYLYYLKLFKKEKIIK